MIDENEDYVTKPKLEITVKAFTKYNDRSRIAAKQINRLRDTENSKHIGRKAKNILANRHRSRLAVDESTQRD